MYARPTSELAQETLRRHAGKDQVGTLSWLEKAHHEPQLVLQTVTMRTFTVDEWRGIEGVTTTVANIHPRERSGVGRRTIDIRESN